MTIKLYGHPIATCTRRVQVVLEEKKVPYEFIEVDMFNKAQKKPEYLEKHPFGVVPYLVTRQSMSFLRPTDVVLKRTTMVS